MNKVFETALVVIGGQEGHGKMKLPTVRSAVTGYGKEGRTLTSNGESTSGMYWNRTGAKGNEGRERRSGEVDGCEDGNLRWGSWLRNWNWRGWGSGSFFSSVTW